MLLSGCEGTGLPLLVLVNPALKMFGDAGIEGPRETTHDVYEAGPVTHRSCLEKRGRDSSRGSPRTRMTEVGRLRCNEN